MAYQNIIFEMDGDVAFITFNRPKALNALNSALLGEFSQALDEISENEKARALVLTGSGDKAFVAGADIKEINTLDPLSAKLFAKKGQDIIARLGESPIPVIAAVNGFALGGGTEIALGCDFIYASQKAVFGLPEITLGIIPGFGGTQRLARLIGPNMAREMVFTGKMIQADEAKELGIVNKVCSEVSLMEEVKKTAQKIASMGRVSLREAKQALNRGLSVDLPTGCLIENDAFAICVTSEDFKEGTDAFIEKRKPSFKGKLNRQ
ncbi:Crotonyl-CoA hydratase [Candidatus Desulfarcum epimagneticum]|uniref:Crotonyl-CoA hydratase n=1 Tax=uncultured Desulfobacteraceae bacterium TaxID=218296 RepID=A0A484HDL2_9BACT|nr:Crotonyl-CoA hydratase [uncultured Desulfobacteraceae bacterium]